MVEEWESKRFSKTPTLQLIPGRFQSLLLRQRCWNQFIDTDTDANVAISQAEAGNDIITAQAQLQEEVQQSQSQSQTQWVDQPERFDDYTKAYSGIWKDTMILCQNGQSWNFFNRCYSAKSSRDQMRKNLCNTLPSWR